MKRWHIRLILLLIWALPLSYICVYYPQAILLQIFTFALYIMFFWDHFEKWAPKLVNWYDKLEEKRNGEIDND